MTDDELFLRTMSELRQLLDAADDEYSLLRATALLRQLLLDSHPLMDQVNQTLRLKVRFEVCGTDYRDAVLRLGPTFYSALNGLHRSGPNAHDAQQLSRDGFLRTGVLLASGHLFTVGELISHAANVKGGVHAGAPKTERERILSEFREVIASDMTMQLTQLESIIRVVVDALAPLEEAIKHASLER